MRKFFHWLGFHQWDSWSDLVENKRGNKEQYRKCLICNKCDIYVWSNGDY
jgi:hypothetical protein